MAYLKAGKLAESYKNANDPSNIKIKHPINMEKMAQTVSNSLISSKKKWTIYI